MRYSDQGLALTKKAEGLRLVAYPDSGKVWTIGYGHTKGVKHGMRCTQAQADAWLVEDVADAEGAVNRLVRVPLTQGQFDALVDFVFNLGEGQFERSTLLRHLNAGQYELAAKQFSRWNLCNGVPLAGLTIRRAEEARLFRGK